MCEVISKAKLQDARGPVPTLSTEMPEESHFESLHHFTARGWSRTADGKAFQTGTAHQGKTYDKFHGSE